MPAIGLAVLIGAVVLVAVVWLIPIDSRRPSTAGVAPSPDGPDAGRRSPGPATQTQVAATIPVRVESPEPPDPAADAPTAGHAATPLPQEDDDDAELQIPGQSSPAPAPAFVSATSSTRTAGFTSQFTRRGMISNQPVTTSTTAATDGGAVSRSAYPRAIPIPVAMSVAEAQNPVEPADSVASEPAPGAPDTTTAPRPTAANARSGTSSVQASSVTWSPQSAETPRLVTAVRRGASSNPIARLSAQLPEDETVRRGLLVAVGAGLVVAVAAAVRH